MNELSDEIHPWVAERRVGVRFGLAGGPRDHWPAARDFVQRAEGLGFDSFWRSDHPTSQSDCWTSLAALAEATGAIRLGSLVSCASYRHPVILARMAADVDVISEGRVVLGLGSGDLEGEFKKLGMPFPSATERGAALADTLAIVRPLLRGESVTHHGPVYSAVEMRLPSPVAPQQPHVPLLIAGGGERSTIPLAARFAEASNMAAAPWGGGTYLAADIRRKLDLLQSHCRAAGRASNAVLMSTLLWPVVLAESRRRLAAKASRLPKETMDFVGGAAMIGSPQQAIERIRSLLAAGFEYFILSVPAYDDETVDLLASKVIPDVEDGTLIGGSAEA